MQPICLGMGIGRSGISRALAGAYWIAVCLLLSLQPAKFAQAQRLFPTVMREQRSIQVRDPSELPRYSLPATPPPPTVTVRQPDLPPRYLSLDEAIRIALLNAQVVRQLAGTTAVSSGRTIYDAAVTNTTIDQQNARFDPTININNDFNKNSLPAAFVDPANPSNVLFPANRTNNFLHNTNINKLNAIGGTFGFGVTANPTISSPPSSVLNPATRSTAQFNYTQPLLQGAGLGPNLAPIVIARINTELSYFQFKDAAQELVRGVSEAYWNLVSARTDVWVRRRQVEQTDYAYRYADAQMRTERDSGANAAQARVSLANFKANLVAAEANLLQREAALRNILGIPPADNTVIVPVSPPLAARFVPDWQALTELAAERRPDLVELKLIIEADQQSLILARNQALPQLNAVGLYRWNGLEGVAPLGGVVNAGAGFDDWTMGVNFSVPIGLRQGRANMRQVELVIARDRVNLMQGLHAAVHLLATNVRAIDQNYETYLAFREAKAAARINIERQLAEFKSSRATSFVVVLQAIADWGNSISSEASNLTQYNTQLTNLERQTGTILEAHGIVFYEERYGSIGPLGRAFRNVCYPQSLDPGPNSPRHTISDEAAENSFNLVYPESWKPQPSGGLLEPYNVPDVLPGQGVTPATPRKPKPPQ